MGSEFATALMVPHEPLFNFIDDELEAFKITDMDRFEADGRSIAQNNSIEDHGAQALSEKLKTNSALTTLDLRVNSIGDNGAQALSEVLKTILTLTTFKSIGDNGAQALSEALKSNSTLITLELQNNLIRINGAQPLH
ncbi:hypothetical protein BGZ82_008428 [Podila clonocystis]|nr:hypothetical protein BGZ82_008428 [Podila clonocystis]